MDDGNTIFLVEETETILIIDGYYTETTVRPKRSSELPIFCYCNGGKSVSSLGLFQNETWPLLKLHGYVSYEIEEGE